MQLLRNLLLAIVFSTACAHVAPHRAGDERLAGVSFEGNKQLSDTTLLTGLGLHRTMQRGGSPDPYTVQVDADRIRGEYLRKGFLGVGVASRVERKGDDARVTYSVEEGPRAVTRTAITGLPPDVPVPTVRSQLPLREGKPFDYEVYDLAKPKLLGIVQDAGYAHAKLDASIVADRAENTALVQLDYAAGPKCKFGKVEVTGVKGDLEDAVLDRVTFTPGQQYSAQAVIQTQRNLYGFGRFSTVQVQPDTAGDNEVVGVKIAVSEGTRHEVKLGGGVGLDPTSYEVRGRAGYSISGWPFPMDVATVDLRPAYALERTQGGGYEPRIRALAKLERQDLFWTYTKTSIEGGYNYLTYEAYTSSGPLARLGFETRLGTERVLLRVGWGIQEVSFSHPMIAEDKQMLIGIHHNERAAGYQQALVVDLRDHPIEPTLGAYGELHVTEGTPYAGGAYTYFSVMPDLRGYVPLLWGTVLAAHARYGAIFAKSGQVPPTERLFSGGTNSQRGFSERELAPFAASVANPSQTVPYGGAGLVDTSIEARVPLTTIKSMPLGAAVFLDGGDVTETPSGLDPAHLHWAIGAGLRLMTIVGPVRFDVGYRLNRTDSSMGSLDPVPGSHYAYHLTIGEAF
jgi:outer membrane protein insertion porin family